MMFAGIAALPVATWAAEPKVKPVGQATVVDATGKKVGSVVNTQGGLAGVLIEVEGRIFSVNVTKDGLVPTGTGLLFATPDCSGTPYLPPSVPNSLVSGSTFGPPGKSLYVEESGAIAQLVLPLSQIIVPPAGPASCVTFPPPPPGVPPPGPALLVPAVQLVNLNVFVPPPFSIRTTP